MNKTICCLRCHKDFTIDDIEIDFYGNNYWCPAGHAIPKEKEKRRHQWVKGYQRTHTGQRNLGGL